MAQLLQQRLGTRRVAQLRDDRREGHQHAVGAPDVAVLGDDHQCLRQQAVSALRIAQLMLDHAQRHQTSRDGVRRVGDKRVIQRLRHAELGGREIQCGELV